MDNDKATITYLSHHDVHTKSNKLKPVFNKLFGNVEVLKPKVGNQFVCLIINDINLWLQNYKSIPTQNLVAVKVDISPLTSLRLGIKSTLQLNPTYKTKDEILRQETITIKNVVDRVSKYLKSVACLVSEVGFESFMPEDAKRIVDYALKGVYPKVLIEKRLPLYKEVYSLVDDDYKTIE